MTNLTIKEIEAITEDKAKEYALTKKVINEHNVYFVDFEGHFGFSALVFKNDHHIYHANQYQLHFEHMVKDFNYYNRIKWLMNKYTTILSNKLFTEKQLTTVSNYDDYTRKQDYINNLYAQQIDYISAFQIFHNDDERKAFERKTKNLCYCPVGFYYSDDVYFIEKHKKIAVELVKAWEKRKDDYNILKEGFLAEMYNHEYPINWQGDWEVLNCFYNAPYKDHYTKEDCKKIGMTDNAIKAYFEAKSECINNFDY